MFGFLRRKKTGRTAEVEELLRTAEGRAKVREHLNTPEGRAELEAFFSTPEGQREFVRTALAEIAERQPKVWDAIVADTRVYSGQMMGPPKYDTRLGFLKEVIRLSWTSDAYFSVLLYRLRVGLHCRGIPVLPSVLHRLSMVLAQIDIGPFTIVQPGVYFPHGQVVIDGVVEIGSGSVICPWVTLGRNGPAFEGPTIAKDAFIGTGAKLLGPIKIGKGARVGANAVVLIDVPADATAAGIPATVRRVGSKSNGSDDPGATEI